MNLPTVNACHGKRISSCKNLNFLIKEKMSLPTLSMSVIHTEIMILFSSFFVCSDFTAQELFLAGKENGEEEKNKLFYH